MQPILLPELTEEQEDALRDMGIDPEELRSRVAEFVSTHTPGKKVRVPHERLGGGE